MRAAIEDFFFSGGDLNSNLYGGVSKHRLGLVVAQHVEGVDRLVNPKWVNG